MNPLPLLALGAGALLLLRKKASAKTDPELESKMIGTELAGLPEETQQAFLRLLLTNDPANDAGVYAGAIIQAQNAKLTFTARKLAEIAKERFG